MDMPAVLSGIVPSDGDILLDMRYNSNVIGSENIRIIRPVIRRGDVRHVTNRS
jgi:hypothetical protein